VLEPDYALADGYAALCHESLFVRAGRREENRQGAIRYAHAALAHGRDDAIALSWGGFSIGMVEHDRAAARKAIQSNPGFSISHMLLAGALAKLRRIDEAKAAAARVLELQPGFRIGEWCAAIDLAPAIAVPLTEALRAASLPE
jgi:hypothetical protein